ncbi:MAG: type II toxin-antitoxin system HicB family antitoxin [SAR324 cluster bacterium]|jgi:predicted RNase H-like HicB family nuclease|nr:type II toxin-antitoxin system HicB family antitoxin [SAR324 cluster bacterium]MCH2265159.1 type II toxin-antitoxin system HicB family antitoxin [SAR324 cluster bacterium]|tara:strand:- start:369 stop:593 length:225 start_codon:yes stop_codon:yes gene_type:complete
MKYLIVIEETSTGFSAYSPDIDGCVATGATKEEVEKNMGEALEFHLEGLRMGHQSIPSPHTYSNYIETGSFLKT